MSPFFDVAFVLGPNDAAKCLISNICVDAAGLEVWINSFIKDIGLRPFVLPEGLTVPLTPGRVDGLVVRHSLSLPKLA